MNASFDELIQDGLNLPIEGWDFSPIKARSRSHSPSWNYKALARSRMRGIHSMLDQDTGGGEVLSSLGPFPPQTWATESYPPNIPIAKNRLEPLGIQLISDYTISSIPLPAGNLDLVLNRHGGYDECELYRLLKPGGIFLTQQVGGKNCIQLNELLQDRVYFEYAYWTKDLIAGRLIEAGFELLSIMEEFPVLEFSDVGAIVFYLRLVSWQVGDFNVDTYRSKLLSIQQDININGPLKVKEHRILAEARKPG